MKEIGILNRNLSRAISEQGHGDLLMVVDAGFATPKEVEVIDLALSENKPMVVDILAELRKYYSVEKFYLAKQTKSINPSLYKSITSSWGDHVEVEIIDHTELKMMAKDVKCIIRTGDFSAYGNVILVSGCGDRWYCEK